MKEIVSDRKIKCKLEKYGELSGTYKAGSQTLLLNTQNRRSIWKRDQPHKLAGQGPHEHFRYTKRSRGPNTTFHTNLLSPRGEGVSWKNGKHGPGKVLISGLWPTCSMPGTGVEDWRRTRLLPGDSRAPGTGHRTRGRGPESRGLCDWELGKEPRSGDGGWLQKGATGGSEPGGDTLPSPAVHGSVGARRRQGRPPLTPQRSRRPTCRRRRRLLARRGPGVRAPGQAGRAAARAPLRARPSCSGRTGRAARRTACEARGLAFAAARSPGNHRRVWAPFTAPRSIGPTQPRVSLGCGVGGGRPGPGQLRGAGQPAPQNGRRCPGRAPGLESPPTRPSGLPRGAPAPGPPWLGGGQRAGAPRRRGVYRYM